MSKRKRDEDWYLDPRKLFFQRWKKKRDDRRDLRKEAIFSAVNFQTKDRRFIPDFPLGPRAGPVRPSKYQGDPERAPFKDNPDKYFPYPLYAHHTNHVTGSMDYYHPVRGNLHRYMPQFGIGTSSAHPDLQDRAVAKADEIGRKVHSDYVDARNRSMVDWIEGGRLGHRRNMVKRLKAINDAAQETIEDTSPWLPNAYGKLGGWGKKDINGRVRPSEIVKESLRNLYDTNPLKYHGIANTSHSLIPYQYNESLGWGFPHGLEESKDFGYTGNELYGQYYRAAGDTDPDFPTAFDRIDPLWRDYDDADEFDNFSNHYYHFGRRLNADWTARQAYRKPTTNPRAAREPEIVKVGGLETDIGQSFTYPRQVKYYRDLTKWDDEIIQRRKHP